MIYAMLNSAWLLCPVRQTFKMLRNVGLDTLSRPSRLDSRLRNKLTAEKIPSKAMGLTILYTGSSKSSIPLIFVNKIRWEQNWKVQGAEHENAEKKTHEDFQALDAVIEIRPSTPSMERISCLKSSKRYLSVMVVLEPTYQCNSHSKEHIPLLTHTTKQAKWLPYLYGDFESLTN